MSILITFVSLIAAAGKLNYLAHIYLSGNSGRLQVGNFIGDFVKGSQLYHYPHEIRKGIVLHRKIDEFTDSHPVVLEVKSFIRPVFGRYSGIIADMYFDYFLAVNFTKYSNRKSLNVFAFRFYTSAIRHYRHLPPRVKGFIFHFISTNRLNRYSSIDGLRDSLQIMAEYKTSAIDPELTIDYLIQNHGILEAHFHLFFPDLVDFVSNEIKM